MQQLDEPKMLFIDLFCGAGGFTEGAERARLCEKKVAKVIACVNHDANAIASHTQNHQHCLHFTEDIRTLELTPLVSVARYARKEYPGAKLFMWASLECTEYSKAKGGLARDADSRTLADHLPRYMDAINFDGIFIENVEEFMSGGPMRIKPKAFHKTYTELTIIKDKKKGYDKYGYEPIPERRGEYYRAWVETMKSYGYNFEYKILNAADYGAHTSRKRYFAVFARPDIPITWPVQTHTKNPKPGSGLEKWKAVKEVLDFADEGESIFTRKKPLSDRTMERVYAGLIKFVAKGEKEWKKKQKFLVINGNGHGRPYKDLARSQTTSPIQIKQLILSVV